MKLRPVVGENLDIWDGFRGNRRLAWRPVFSKKQGQPAMEELAARCRCGVWWGWTYLHKAQEMLAKFDEKGCLRCRS
jgi:hypothetical protein